MTPSRRPFRLLTLAALLAAAATLPAAAQETSPCGAGEGTLIRDWRAEGLPGTDGRLARSSFECLADGTIRQVVEVSADEGRTWRVLFESTYAPAANAPPAAAAPRTSSPPSPAIPDSSASPPAQVSPPAAGPPVQPAASGAPVASAPPSAERPERQHQAARQASEEGSEVQALTRELEREEIPETEAPELVMASPMVLELRPGEVDEYPEGTAWSTDETAGFICGQVVIKRVTVGRRVKGGRTFLEVGAQLFTKRRQRSADLLVEVLLDGQVMVSERLTRVRLGLNIPGHGKDGVPVDTLLELQGDAFERMFADGADRAVRLTLTVAD